jgi:hypothetical protein
VACDLNTRPSSSPFTLEISINLNCWLLGKPLNSNAEEMLRL